MKLIKGRPLIRSATHPDVLFRESEKEQIKAYLSAKHQRERYGKENKNTTEQEKRQRGNLIRLADFNGYSAHGVNSQGNIIWWCMVQGLKRTPQVIISIMPCEECSVNFHAHHYEDEMPPVMCDGCERKKRPFKATPARLKYIIRKEYNHEANQDDKEAQSRSSQEG